MNSAVMSQPGGIDIHAALAILSARTPHEHHDDDHPQSSSDPPSLPSAVDNNTRARQSSTATNEENNDDDTEGASAVAGEERQRQRQRQGERVNEMQTQLTTMSIPQLIKMIFTAQEERVATYRAFEEGLTSIISTGNITAYPAICASITASFVVLSNTINSVRSVLLSTTTTTTTTTATTTTANNNSRDVNQEELREFINYATRLQMHECTKLNLTAALHLERLRLLSSTTTSSSSSLSKNEEEVQEEEEEENDGISTPSNDGSNSTATIMRLLQESIHKLEIDLSANIIQINDVLEEMRCLAADIIIVD